MGSTTTTGHICMSRRYKTHVSRNSSDLSRTCVGSACVDLRPHDYLQAIMAQPNKSFRGLRSSDYYSSSVGFSTSAQRPAQWPRVSCNSPTTDSFQRLLELPQELLNQIYSAYCEPYHITLSCPPLRQYRNSSRLSRPYKKLSVKGPPSANFSMANSKIYSELEEPRRDAFDGELYIHYDETEGLNALRELCVNEKYSWIRERVIRLVIGGVKGLNFKGTEYFLDFWNDIAKPDALPQLKEIDITYEAKRSKYVVQEADFEIPTEEWFKVSAQEYIDSFKEGGEDIEYEYPEGLLQLRELKQLLMQNDKQTCEVFLTTRVTWKHLRDENSAQAQNDRGSLQSVTFRVVSDDLEGRNRVYR